ncbi:MAG: kynureninase [Burkholderiaceae bacterium]
MATVPLSLRDCEHLDTQDPLQHLRSAFQLPQGVIYLDGNSLGALPRNTAQVVADAVRTEWGEGLIRSWNDAGWIDLPQRIGDKIASLIGAAPGTVVATDSTSINLYKVLSAAIGMAGQDAPQRKRVVSERSNFPTDLYIAQSVCRQHGCELQLVDASELDAALTDEVAVLMLTHVNYRTGAMFDMQAVTRRAHAAGALVVWDLAHSAGAVPVALQDAQADYAVGCGYKYLNGGPGAPAFVWVHPRHTDRFWQPLSGWFGHAAPFAFTPGYEPAQGIQRYLCGTQPILSLRALECGVDSVLAAGTGGDAMRALRRKSLALTDLFITLVEQRCASHDLKLVTPREHARRGSQVSLARQDGAYPIMQALIARGVIGDFRAGDPQATLGHVDQMDILRFGFTPLYNSFADVWHAVEHLQAVLSSSEWTQARFNSKQAVT